MATIVSAILCTIALLIALPMSDAARGASFRSGRSMQKVPHQPTYTQFPLYSSAFEFQDTMPFYPFGHRKRFDVEQELRDF